MHRLSLLDLLAQYQSTDHEEQRFKIAMISFIKQHPNCFERSLEIGHITASAWLLNRDNSQALLMHHTKLDRWFQLGGHCDGDPDVLGVAVREAQEESGLMFIEPVMPTIFDIDIHLIPANSKEKEHYHYDVRFLLQVAGDTTIMGNRESKELRWITKDPALLPTNSRSVVRMFDKWGQLFHL